MTTEALHEGIREAERLRILDHEEAERAYQKRFSDALKTLDESQEVSKQ